MTHWVTTELTKKLMADALKKKMMQKPLSKITIQELTRDCGLNRQTFYYHFQDIYDLVEWMFNQEAIEMVRQNVHLHTWQEACLHLVHYMEANHQVCLCALNSLGRSHLNTFFYKNLSGLIHDQVEEASKGTGIAEKHKEFLTSYYSVTFAGMLVSWLKGEVKGTPEEVIHMLSVTLTDGMSGAVLRFAQEDKK